MSLAYAVERLYEMGWAAGGELEVPGGLRYPSLAEIRKEFADAGLAFQVRHVALFNCHRAEWSGEDGTNGYCVGTTEAEAAVYALAQLCASRVAVGA
jgi:hypothetical protein